MGASHRTRRLAQPGLAAASDVAAACRGKASRKQRKRQAHGEWPHCTSIQAELGAAGASESRCCRRGSVKNPQSGFLTSKPDCMMRLDNRDTKTTRIYSFMDEFSLSTESARLDSPRQKVRKNRFGLAAGPWQGLNRRVGSSKGTICID